MQAALAMALDDNLLVEKLTRDLHNNAATIAGALTRQKRSIFMMLWRTHASGGMQYEALQTQVGRLISLPQVGDSRTARDHMLFKLEIVPQPGGQCIVNFKKHSFNEAWAMRVMVRTRTRSAGFVKAGGYVTPGSAGLVVAGDLAKARAKPGSASSVYATIINRSITWKMARGFARNCTRDQLMLGMGRIGKLRQAEEDVAAAAASAVQPVPVKAPPKEVRYQITSAELFGARSQAIAGWSKGPAAPKQEPGKRALAGVAAAAAEGSAYLKVVAAGLTRDDLDRVVLAKLPFEARRAAAAVSRLEGRGMFSLPQLEKTLKQVDSLQQAITRAKAASPETVERKMQLLEMITPTAQQVQDLIESVLMRRGSKTQHRQNQRHANALRAIYLRTIEWNPGPQVPPAVRGSVVDRAVYYVLLGVVRIYQTMSKRAGNIVRNIWRVADPEPYVMAQQMPTVTEALLVLGTAVLFDILGALRAIHLRTIHMHPGPTMDDVIHAAERRFGAHRTDIMMAMGFSPTRIDACAKSALDTYVRAALAQHAGAGLAGVNLPTGRRLEGAARLLARPELLPLLPQDPPSAAAAAVAPTHTPPQTLQLQEHGAAAAACCEASAAAAVQTSDSCSIDVGTGMVSVMSTASGPDRRAFVRDASGVLVDAYADAASGPDPRGVAETGTSTVQPDDVAIDSWYTSSEDMYAVIPAPLVKDRLRYELKSWMSRNRRRVLALVWESLMLALLRLIKDTVLLNARGGLLFGLSLETLFSTLEGLIRSRVAGRVVDSLPVKLQLTAGISPTTVVTSSYAICTAVGQESVWPVAAALATAVGTRDVERTVDETKACVYKWTVTRREFAPGADLDARGHVDRRSKLEEGEPRLVEAVLTCHRVHLHRTTSYGFIKNDEVLNLKKLTGQVFDYHEERLWETPPMVTSVAATRAHARVFVGSTPNEYRQFCNQLASMANADRSVNVDPTSRLVRAMAAGDFVCALTASHITRPLFPLPGEAPVLRSSGL